ncbi:bifunctional metallophosphatase/5'-nucleotidase [Pontixanthobacter aestiaquae]|uniref:Bifunctional metallophosphatase/5'-nucleotidase n=1 Tax=Pontixanthobacter aestiaquae TaxID=1509367 RepID=A0A844Z5J2_9SPHN|nr:bifunctional metallophosphatase/5'-nucleotidase [Pontixanthobacter aestiaquae]MDN3646660.1 bifunctional metallophosphatase/5'-nucleotidase [Pontixanthobacter aestiaquae]MXO82357.1 bifunctional metallophosphatase/5'-nucleotidase [Pontixanthobacter aestiaquae]
MNRLILSSLAALSVSACATVPDAPAQFAQTEPVTIKIIGLNDFHGNIEPIRRPIGVMDNAGQTQRVYAAGAAYLATAVEQYRSQSEYSIVIAAGDLIGGSPLVSSIFLDEPAIGAMNRIGLDFNAVGNHEFDRGWKELKRIQEGGCEQNTLREPCAVENPYPGAEFRFLAANVVMPDGDTLFPGYGIKRFDVGGQDVAVGIIGLTLKDTPTLVTPSGVEGLTFTDEANAINDLIPDLQKAGADAIVVTIHQGLYTEVGFNNKSCDGVSGPLLDILAQLDPKIDVVVSGHTHNAYVCDYSAIDPSREFLVTSAGYGGSMLTDITLTVDPNTGDVMVKTADNIVVQSVGTDREGNVATPSPDYQQFTANPEIAAYVARYSEASREAAQRPIGKISGEAKDPGPSTEETALGNLIADAQLFGTLEAGAQIAFMNNSGIRTGLTPAEDGTITYGEAYAVQPFGNTLITKSFTGAQLLALLEQQFDDEGFVQTFSPSKGFAMTYDMRRPVGARVVSVTLDGEAIDPAATYRVTMNSFLAAGGDSFTIFNDGADIVTGPVDLDAIEAYLQTADVMELPALGRVTENK